MSDDGGGGGCSDKIRCQMMRVDEVVRTGVSLVYWGGGGGCGQMVGVVVEVAKRVVCLVCGESYAIR